MEDLKNDFSAPILDFFGSKGNVYYISGLEFRCDGVYLICGGFDFKKYTPLKFPKDSVIALKTNEFNGLTIEFSDEVKYIENSYKDVKIQINNDEISLGHDIIARVRSRKGSVWENPSIQQLDLCYLHD